MVFYAGRIIRERAMANPTIVVLTDRNDLDDQLFGTFSRCRELLRQPPVQAASRADLRAKLAVDSGGVVFTTIQKFFPEEKGDTHPGAIISCKDIAKIRSAVFFRDRLGRMKPGFAFRVYMNKPGERGVMLGKALKIRRNLCPDALFR